MDPLNMKYKDFSDCIEKVRLSPETFMEWYNRAENKTWVQENYQSLKKENSRTLSYYNLKYLRFLTGLFDSIQCIGCFKTFGFGVHNLYCDPCIESKRCVKSCQCEFKIGSGNAAACPHHNSVVDTIRGDFWDYIKNYPYRPEHIKKSSGKYVWMNCPKCKHSLYIILDYFNSTKNYGGCLYCTGTDLCSDEKCKTCEDKSVLASNKMHLWSDRNEVNARMTRQMCGEKRYFDCDKCYHQYYAVVSNVMGSVNNGCGYCTGDDLCDLDACKFCLNNSFASHPKSIFYFPPPYNEKTARQLRKGSRTQGLFWCSECKKPFYCCPSDACRGIWCGCTVNRTEKVLLDFLETNFPVKPDYQFNPEWIRSPLTKSLLYFDICLGRFIIESDGEQHTSNTQVCNWQDPITIRKRDVFKMIQAVNRGYSFIRIYQRLLSHDVLYWRPLLIRVINELAKDPTPRVYYIENQHLTVNHYKIHQKMFGEYINKDMSQQDWKDFLVSEDE